MLYTIYYILYTIYYIAYSIYYILFMVYYIRYMIYYILCSMHYILCTYIHTTFISSVSLSCVQEYVVASYWNRFLRPFCSTRHSVVCFVDSSYVQRCRLVIESRSCAHKKDSWKIMFEIH